MAEGKVKKVVVEKGYGFIQPGDGGGDIFFHHSSLVGVAIEDLPTGVDVSYDVSPGNEGKGPRAVNVSTNN
jgi:CspA family cold shock protein